MARKITYWIATGLVAALSLFAGYAYVSGSPQAVEGFAYVGYPQQLRILLEVAKLLGAITLLAPGLPKLKEWRMEDSRLRGSPRALHIIWPRMDRRRLRRWCSWCWWRCRT